MVLRQTKPKAAAEGQFPPSGVKPKDEIKFWGAEICVRQTRTPEQQQPTWTVDLRSGNAVGGWRTTPIPQEHQKWRTGTQYEITSQDAKELKKDKERRTQVVDFMAISQVEFKDHEDAVSFEEAWSKSEECTLYMLGAECTCTHQRSMGVTHSGPPRKRASARAEV
jgi:hypothetical protein